jgi:hypothetical protein
MSKSDSARDEPILCRDDDWWGGEPAAPAVDNGDDDDSDEWGPHHTDYEGINDPAKIIAHRLLKETASLICATTLFADPYNGGELAEAMAFVFDGETIDGHGDAMHLRNEPVPLSDPELHVPRDASDTFGTRTFGQKRHRRRVNERTGYVSGGESTGVVIQDRSLEAFISVVNLWLESHPAQLSDAEKQEARQTAYRLKQSGDYRDVDALATVVREVRESLRES